MLKTDPVICPVVIDESRSERYNRILQSTGVSSLETFTTWTRAVEASADLY